MSFGGRSQNLRGGSAFNGRSMGATPDLNALIQQALLALQQQESPAAPPAPFDLVQLANQAMQTSGGQQLVDNTLNAIMDDPILRAEIERRALAIIWERYKGVLILSGVAVGVLLYYALKENSPKGADK